MPRALTLLSLTFKNQNRPIQILKNFIFLVIHDTKAVLHFSGNPGWQNWTKTCFSDQKISFSLYHLHRLGHPGRGKMSFIYHCRRQPYQLLQIIMYFCWRDLEHSGDQRKSGPLSGSLGRRSGCSSPVPSTLLQLKGLEEEREGHKTEEDEGTTATDSTRALSLRRDLVCHC